MKQKDEGKEPTPWVHPGGGPIYKLAIRYLVDGEWHDMERVVQYLIPKVHPGKATRRAERARKFAKGKMPDGTRRQAPPERLKYADDMDRVIRIGARAISREVFRQRAFEVDTPGNRVRIRPDKLNNAREAVKYWEKKEGEAAFKDEDPEED